MLSLCFCLKKTGVCLKPKGIKTRCFPGPERIANFEMNMTKRKLSWFEAGFFFFYFIVLQFFTDLQYILEYGNENLASATIQRLTTTPLLALSFYFYYKRLLPLLFEKKHLRFLTSVVVFLLFLECFLHLVDWWASINPMVSEKARQSSKQLFLNPPFPRQMIALTITELLILTGLGYFVKKTEDEIKLRILKEQHTQLQLDYLKAQLHPHFFFNTLNNIYSLSLDASSETAPTVAKLADLMRYIIYEGSKKAVPLEREIAFLRNYIALEKIRHTKTKDIHFCPNGKVNGTMIEPLLLIPLVENGFKHGLANSLGNAWLHIDLNVNKEQLCLQVRNSKSGQHSPHEGGMGLQNIRQRLQLLYPGRHLLQIKEDDATFSAILQLNLTS
jgi:hypothetical protein